MAFQKIRTLAFLLLFSAALNVACFVYFILDKGTSAQKTSIASSRVSGGNQEMLSVMSSSSFRELLSFLTNRDPLEEGYTKRDLALATLVAYHHFHLEKALGAPVDQVRLAKGKNDQPIHLFPGLTDEQYEAIIRFAYREKWPLNAKGLFLYLQAKQDSDPSLERAFFHTPEFHALELLFQKTKQPQDPSTLLSLCLEGSFQFLEEFFQSQTKSPNFSIETRRSFLLKYIKAQSMTAAELLLKTDFTYALKKLGDEEMLSLLLLLKKPTEMNTSFCCSVLESSRSDHVIEASAQNLYSYAGKSAPKTMNLEQALLEFSSPKVQDSPPKAQPPLPRFHVVQEGESLWKISRKYQVKVDDIVKVNGLEKDALFPGMTLKIP